MYTIGITVGKFMPPHLGHEFFIDFGASLLDEMFVIVSGKESDIIPLSKRVEWLTEHYKGSNVTILSDIDDIPMGEVDEHGTVIDSNFWVKWTEKFNHYVPNATHFVSSDYYGQRAANELGIKWLPVDPNRHAIQICATDIRDNPFRNIDYILGVAKPYFNKKIAIVGPESTGKSTLVNTLATHFGTIFAPEYGRTVAASKNNNLNVDDFDTIFKGQNKLIELLNKKASNILISDTEAFTTYLYGKIYLNQDLTYIKEYAITQQFDLYLLLAPTVEWINDGTRVNSDEKIRIEFYENMKSFLIENNKQFVIIDSNDFKIREEKAIEYINKLL